MTDDETKQLIEDLRVALRDWMHQYAPDFCETEGVQSAMNHIASHGGTLAYIAELNRRANDWRRRHG